MDSNEYCKHLIKIYGGSLLDENKIVWQWVNDEWIGKRSVWTYDFRACWIEHTTPENVKSYWCGKNADYNEIIKNPA